LIFLVFEVFPNFTEYTLPFSKADLVVKKIFQQKSDRFRAVAFLREKKEMNRFNQATRFKLPLARSEHSGFIRCVR
jgi:hypothetical protein